MTPALVLRDVDFAFGRRPVLRGVNLVVPAGVFTAIIGPNGGGKSTILKLALGLLEPDRGEVELLGERPARSRRRVGYLPQASFQDPEFPITVRDAVGHGRLGRGRNWGPLSRLDRAAALAALAETDCADLADRPLSRLSGGQRQRVLIARALATEPELLVLDEPAAGLDPTSQTDLYDLLSRLSRRLTVLVVSHQVSLVSRHVAQVVCVHDGHLHLPSTAEIAPELADFFPDVHNMVLVRHEHDECPEHRTPRDA
ncbi:MAG TPA: metal ABC transporter ATP-binding protein [Candidatus Krumholzibacteria bacterium]|nr:metal ABC transporter ATP-binding protein [Candidatus Krumholzibacteria bacterium]HPD72477.1 metal ABC transporter ATP-binding protein [Candidatus Krumholzibacteria bacterium]HRY40591.1 metal ABC transporter ATP-binding protein [Candidatus Krumholzibacteria bacterium]